MIERGLPEGLPLCPGANGLPRGLAFAVFAVRLLLRIENSNNLKLSLKQER